MKSRVGQFLQGHRAVAAALITAVALLGVPASASAAASPVLEFVAPGHSWPVSLTTKSGPVTAEMAGSELVLECAESQGEGEITGPRSVVAKYQFTGCKAHELGKPTLHNCKSSSVEEEIATGPIEADLVWINQAKDEVGMLLNPNGGPTQPYISFTCGGIEAAGFGPFLSPGSPINQNVSEFTMTLKRLGSTQTVTEYEGEKGEKLQAVPTGEKEKNGQKVDTSVEMTVAVHTSVPIEVRAITAAEVEAKQREEEATAKKHQEEAAKKKQEEEAAAAAKKHQEEEAATKKRQEEEAAKKKQEEENKAKSKPTRAQLLAKALKQCKKEKPKSKRMQCEKAANKKYGKIKKKKHKK